MKISVSYSLDKPTAKVQPGRHTILWDVLAGLEKLDGDAKSSALDDRLQQSRFYMLV